MPLILFPPWTKAQQQSATVYEDEANTFTATGNNFDEILAVDKGLQFPATQVADAGANVLDDYEEGTWTPTLTAATPGNLSVVYITRVGSYTKVGEVVRLDVYIETSTFTHTTASGRMRITGVPFTNNAAYYGSGSLTVDDFTKAGYVCCSAIIDPNTAIINGYASGSGVSAAYAQITDFPTGQTPVFTGSVLYRV